MCTYICILLCHKWIDHIEIQCENICLSMVLGQLATYVEKIHTFGPCLKQFCSKWILGLNVKAKEKNVIWYLHNLGLDTFLKQDTKITNYLFYITTYAIFKSVQFVSMIVCLLFSLFYFILINEALNIHPVLLSAVW